MSESDGIPTVTWFGDVATIDGRTYRVSPDLAHDAGIAPCPGHCADCGDTLDPDEAHPVGLDAELCADCCGCDAPETWRSTP